MKLSISNIAWSAEFDQEMYLFLQKNEVKGLEIAPTRIFPNDPYNHIEEAKEWANKLNKQYGLQISSMQSIWYGKTENIFSSKENRQNLINYTKQAIDFAEAIGCHNLVFGNPKNRDTTNLEQDLPIAISFFHEIGEYAYQHNTTIALEPNPAIYNTHFMNYTHQAVEMVRLSGSRGIKVNYDLGAIICNEEKINDIINIQDYINHIHISEPSLNLIEKRTIHNSLIDILKKNNYSRFVSIEMGNKGSIDQIKYIINYILSLIQNN